MRERILIWLTKYTTVRLYLVSAKGMKEELILYHVKKIQMHLFLRDVHEFLPARGRNRHSQLYRVILFHYNFEQHTHISFRFF